MKSRFLRHFLSALVFLQKKVLHVRNCYSFNGGVFEFLSKLLAYFDGVVCKGFVFSVKMIYFICFVQKIVVDCWLVDCCLGQDLVDRDYSLHKVVVGNCDIVEHSWFLQVGHLRIDRIVFFLFLAQICSQSEFVASLSFKTYLCCHHRRPQTFDVGLHLLQETFHLEYSHLQVHHY
jgi:hypothetical protein